MYTHGVDDWLAGWIARERERLHRTSYSFFIFIFQLQLMFSIILHQVQVYSIVVRQSCALQSVPPKDLFFFFFIVFIVVQFQYSCLFPHCSSLPCSPALRQSIPTTIIHAHESYICVPWLASSPSSPVIPLTTFLWSLSVCSSFPSLWLYFAHLFVLLIRFHLQVRLHGIRLSLPGLFHSA